MHVYKYHSNICYFTQNYKPMKRKGNVINMIIHTLEKTLFIILFFSILRQISYIHCELIKILSKSYNFCINMI